MSNSLIIGWASYVVEGKRAWWISLYYGYLLEVDLDSYCLVGAYRIPEKTVELSHIGMSKWDRYIYMFPYCGAAIYKFDTVSHRFEIIAFPFADDNYLETPMKFNITSRYESNIVFIGHSIPGIFILDTGTDEIRRFPIDIGEIKSEDSKSNDICFLDGYCNDNENLYIPLYKTNVVLKLDMNNFNYERIRLDSKLNLHTICKYNYFYVLSSTNKEIIKWNPSDNKLIIIDPQINEMQSKNEMLGNSYREIIVCNNKTYIFPLLLRKVYLYSNDSLQELRFDSSGSRDRPENVEPQYSLIIQHCDDIIFQVVTSGQIFKLDTKSDIISEITISVPRQLIKQVSMQVYKNTCKISVAKESDLLNIETMLEALISDV